MSSEQTEDHVADYASVEDWHAEARRLFGDDQMEWRFVCPSCGHVASVKDWKDAGSTEGSVAFSCVGRWLDSPHDAFQMGNGPCNYAGGGLFAINPVSIQTGGTISHAFAFAEEADDA